MRAEITPYYESLWSLPLALRATFYRYPLICLSAILVSLSAAFFRVWRLTRRIMLFVPQSSVYLASSSQSLNRYVFFPNNYLHLASFSRPNSLACRVLSTFHIIPEQSFAFCYIKEGFEPSPIPAKWNCSTTELFANLLRCAAPVAPYLVRYSIQHTSCLSSCELLNLTSSLQVLPFQLL